VLLLQLLAMNIEAETQDLELQHGFRPSHQSQNVISQFRACRASRNSAIGQEFRKNNGRSNPASPSPTPTKPFSFVPQLVLQSPGEKAGHFPEMPPSTHTLKLFAVSFVYAWVGLPRGLARF